MNYQHQMTCYKLGIVAFLDHLFAILLFVPSLVYSQTDLLTEVDIDVPSYSTAQILSFHNGQKNYICPVQVTSIGSVECYSAGLGVEPTPIAVQSNIANFDVVNLYGTAAVSDGRHDALVSLVDANGNARLGVAQITEDLVVDSLYTSVPIIDQFVIYYFNYLPRYNPLDQAFEWVVTAFDSPRTTFGSVYRFVRSDEGYEVFEGGVEQLSLRSTMVLDTFSGDYFMFKGGNLYRYDADLQDETAIPIDLSQTPLENQGPFWFIEEIREDSIVLLENHRGPDYSSDLYDVDGYVWRYVIPKTGSEELLPPSKDSLFKDMLDNIRLYNRQGDLNASIWHEGFSIQSFDGSTILINSPLLTTTFSTTRRENEIVTDLAILDNRSLLVTGFYDRRFEMFYYILDLNDPFLTEVDRTTIPLEAGHSVYPNPTQGKVFTDQDVDAFEVFAVTGQQLTPYTSLREEDSVIDLGHLPAGTYVLRLYLGGRQYSRQVVKQ
jgi:hypothetical protein